MKGVIKRRRRRADHVRFAEIAFHTGGFDFCRSPSIPASWKMAREARRGAIDRIGGLLICHPSAEGTGMNSGSRCMRKRVFGSLPNQPARRGKFVLVACRSCTKAPATAPGPALRYL